MATPLDALEALLQFPKRAPVPSSGVRLAIPVANPLDPTQSHVIQGRGPTPIAIPRVTFHSFFEPTVPDPLAAPVSENDRGRAALPMISAEGAAHPPSTQNMGLMRGFVVNPAKYPASDRTHSDNEANEAPRVDGVGTDKILRALRSKPQRGKKRDNLSDLERQELGRIRNRENSRNTRMKKKARLLDLVEVERKFLLLKEREELNLLRRQRLVGFVESAGDTRGGQKDCPHSSRLVGLASPKIHNAEFSVMDDVALTTENSGMVSVMAHGMDSESGEPMTLSGVVRADFAPELADVCAVSLFWASPSDGIPPLVNVVSF